MIETKYKEIMNVVFDRAINKLYHTSELPISVAQKVIKLRGELLKERDIFLELVKKIDEKKPDQATKDKEWNELIEIEIVVKGEKIKTVDLGDIKITAAELSALSPILEN